MKNLLTILLLAFTLNVYAQKQEIIWHTDIEKAIDISIKTEKPLFLFFTGSDWCGWCKRLVKEVFIKPDFAIWASKNVVLVELDYPRRIKLPESTQEQNRELGQLFQVRGYPTGWFVIPESKEINKLNLVKLGSQGYVSGGSEAWITGANEILKNK